MQGLMSPALRKIQVWTASRTSYMQVDGRSRCGTGLSLRGHRLACATHGRAVSLVVQPADVDGNDGPGLYVRLSLYTASQIPSRRFFLFPWL